jgi:GAF domain-containing protein
MSVHDRSNRTARDVPSQLHALHFTTAGLSALLEQITVLAADTVDVDTSVGITVIRHGRAVTVTATDERAEALDEMQYNEGDGPCLSCARTGQVVTMDNSTTDERWPKYQMRAIKAGLRNSLSMPLTLGENAAGAMNFYFFEPHRLSDQERSVIGQFCDEASRTMSLALRHDQLATQNDHLHTAMGTRRVIDQAIGIIMAQNRCSAGEAFGVLRRASQNRNVKINQLAAEMIRTVTGSEPDHHAHWRD